MYLHLGNRKYVRRKNVLGIFDFDTSTVAVTTRRYLSLKEKEGRLSSVDDEIPKSFVLTLEEENGKTADKVYLTKLSSWALFERTAENAEAESYGTEK
ncbi:MAG: DUF370 domain-containing protein [Clostridia bacterium]|nr:DUF370 domain-containing protein [Clostridia bacterium]